MLQVLLSYFLSSESVYTDSEGVSCRVCWHQGLRQALNSPARFATYSLLGLRRGGLAGRYLSVALVFFLSGALHIFGDMTAGLRWYDSGVVQYFCAQALGLIIEDSAQAVYHFVIVGGINSRSEKREVMGPPSLWQRVLGSVWVISFMAWSVPVYIYPMSRRDRGQGVLPIRILDR